LTRERLETARKNLIVDLRKQRLKVFDTHLPARQCRSAMAASCAPTPLRSARTSSRQRLEQLRVENFEPLLA